MTIIARSNEHRSNRLRPWVWGGAAALLSLPALAMMAGVPGVNWGVEDFIVMGGLMALACGGYELAAWLSGHWAYRAGAAAAIGAAFLTVWVNLAVGMLGSEGNPANLLFALVILVGGIGGLLGGFKPRAMTLAMLAAAAVQALITVYALVAYGAVAGLVGLFVLPWLVSAGLFRLADRLEPNCGRGRGDVRGVL